MEPGVLAEQINNLRARVAQLEAELSLARGQRTEREIEDARQARIDETARRIWTEESFRQGDEYTSPQRLAEMAYRQAATLEVAREEYIAARSGEIEGGG